MSSRSGLGYGEYTFSRGRDSFNNILFSAFSLRFSQSGKLLFLSFRIQLNKNHSNLSIRGFAGEGTLRRCLRILRCDDDVLGVKKTKLRIRASKRAHRSARRGRNRLPNPKIELQRRNPREAIKSSLPEAAVKHRSGKNRCAPNSGVDI